MVLTAWTVALIACLVLVFICFALVYPIYKVFKKSIYKQESGIGFFQVFKDGNEGALGEYKTCLELEKISGYKKILINTYLLKQNNKTTEVDLICISAYGIFVVENKNYTGKVYMNKDKPCVYYPHHKKVIFNNPIRQNMAHIKALKEITGANDNQIYSMIVFNNNAKLQKVEETDNRTFVVLNKQLKKTIEEIESTTEQIFTNAEIESIYNKLQPFTHATKKEKEKHIADIQAIQH